MASDPAQVSKSIHFGDDFELNPRAHQLLRSGRPLELERIPMEVLPLLVERRGQLVSREQIAERIWGKNHFLDTDNSINGAVRKIRHVLGDDSEQPRFIQTVTGRGYCFIASVREPEADGTSEASRLEPPSPVARRQSRTWLALGVMLSVLVIAAVAAGVVWSRAPAAESLAGRAILAVLPFQNLTGNDVRVAAQLIRSKDQTHLWARQYDRELTGLLTLQGEIAQQIADEILPSLGNPRRKAVAQASARL